jgi:hypothetical protein
VLLAVAGVLALLLPRGEHHAAPPATSTATPPPPATTATTPAPQGVFASEPAFAPTSPSSVVLRFDTIVPARASVAYGIDGNPPTLWLGEPQAATHHELSLEGTVLTRQYAVQLHVSGGGRSDGRTLTLPPRALDAAPVARVADGALQLDGHPFFPLMSWAQCAAMITPSLAQGINLFLADPCGGVEEQVQTLQGRALVAGTADDTATGAGLIGYAYTDEADARGLTAETLPGAAAAGSGRVSFLTLTNHFFSGAAPLPRGRAMYPGLVSRTDMIGFDLYPLQEWCEPGRIAAVEAAQRELVQLARGKPTYQWIEAATMKCLAAEDAVTPAVLRAETLLALVGGAHGIGFFPPEWDGNLNDTVATLTRDLDAIAPALLEPPLRAQASGGVFVVAHSYRGALYVLAVNPNPAPVTAHVAVAGLGARGLTVLDEGRTVQARGGAFTEAFPPLGARIYVAAPRWAAAKPS